MSHALRAHAHTGGDSKSILIHTPKAALPLCQEIRTPKKNLGCFSFRHSPSHGCCTSLVFHSVFRVTRRCYGLSFHIVYIICCIVYLTQQPLPLLRVIGQPLVCEHAHWVVSQANLFWRRSFSVGRRSGLGVWGSNTGVLSPHAA